MQRIFSILYIFISGEATTNCDIRPEYCDLYTKSIPGKSRRCTPASL